MGSAQMSDYLEVQVGKVLFCTQVAWKPAAIWVALYTVAPTDAGGGTEVTGGNYARVQVTQADAQWNIPTTTGLFSNVNDITFPAPNANWGSVVAYGILDNSSGGNLLIWDTLTTPKTVNSGDPAPKFSGGAPGALQITFA